jgi:hypothetical protein
VDITTGLSGVIGGGGGTGVSTGSDTAGWDAGEFAGGVMGATIFESGGMLGDGWAPDEAGSAWGDAVTSASTGESEDETGFPELESSVII